MTKSEPTAENKTESDTNEDTRASNKIDDESNKQGSIFDNLINQYVNDNQRLLVYFGVALISLYILQINNVSLK